MLLAVMNGLQTKKEVLLIFDNGDDSKYRHRKGNASN